MLHTLITRRFQTSGYYISIYAMYYNCINCYPFIIKINSGTIPFYKHT